MSSYATNAAGVSKYTAERHQRILQELYNNQEMTCARIASLERHDGARGTWVYLFVYNVPVYTGNWDPYYQMSDRKSVNLDAWSKEQVESVKNMGNIASNAKWNPNEARHPPPTNLEESERDSEMEKYIRAKYETKKFLDRKPAASATFNSSSTPVAPAQPSASTPIPRQPKPKPEETDPTQTIPLGFGRESRVEFNLPGMGGDIWDGIIQQKKVPPRSKTAPIPEPVAKVTPPPAPVVPAPVPLTNLPSRSLSAQPPSVGQLGVNTSVPAAPANGVWGDMLALQSAGGSLPTSAIQAPPLQPGNPYASLSASPSTTLPSTLTNRMGASTSALHGCVNSLLSVPTGNSFGSVGLGATPGGSFGSVGSLGSGSGGMGISPGGLNPFGASSGSAFGTSPGGSFGTATGGSLATPGVFIGGSTGTFGVSPGGLGGLSMLQTGQMTSQPSQFQQPTQPSPFQQTMQSSPFQQSTLSPFGGATSSLTSPSTNATSLSAFGAAMSPPGQASNSPFAQPSASPFTHTSNSPFAQPTNSPFGQPGTQFSSSANSPFQTTNPGFQSTPTNNALFLQPNTTQFQSSNSPFQASNSPSLSPTRLIKLQVPIHLPRWVEAEV
ncbi:GTPase activating protein for Arf protein [Rhizoctonia solani]|uniref:GTPase activating protein for Arf protein n=1 Tax=Rhizoctonia solani TaxID=456999 RepID=A0A8H8P7I7_9AGAM|nr:GTPase activating protein for Arf protein [Rhizoctonia solani]QRW25980.1 GTPase activating protein for Arf protein [Rhizoctonia solani]